MNTIHMKKPVKITLTFLIVIFASTAIVAQNQNPEIGYVDPQAILTKMPEMKAVQQRLQNFAERKQRELSQKEQEFQSEVANFEQKSGVISDEARAREEERLGQLQVELLQFRDQAEQEIAQKRAELLGPLLQQMQQAIDTVAQRMGLSYVLNTTTSSGDLIILYVSEEIRTQNDITDAVMEELGLFE